jgi:hypothetical protein
VESKLGGMPIHEERFAFIRQTNAVRLTLGCGLGEICGHESPNRVKAGHLSCEGRGGLGFACIQLKLDREAQLVVSR